MIVVHLRFSCMLYEDMHCIFSFMFVAFHGGGWVLLLVTAALENSLIENDFSDGYKCVYTLHFSGLFVMAHLFANGGKSIIVGILALIVTLSFGLVALGDGLLLVKVRK